MIKWYIMKKKNIVAVFLLMFFAVCANAQTNEERVYIQELTLMPGGEMQCMTIALENGSYDNYTGFQFDVELPEGLEVAYYDGEPEIYKAEGDHVYPSRRDDHVVAYRVDGNLVKIRCYSATNKLFEKTNGALIDIYVVPTAYLKPGDVEVKLHDVKFSTSEETYGYKADVVTSNDVKSGNECTLAIKISSSNKYSTAVFPFDVANIPEDLEVYSCNSIDGGYLMLERQKSIVAYRPYILFAYNGFDKTFSGTVDVNKYEECVVDGYITGTLVTQEIGGGNGYYVMQNKGEGAMFYKVGDTTFSIPAGKCWVTIPAGSQAAAFFRFGQFTSIDGVEGEVGDVVVYDLGGRQVENPGKGLFIINGEKMLVK